MTGEYLTLQDAAVHAGMSYAALYKAARHGRLAARQWGSRWYVTPAALSAWQARPRRPGPRPGTPSPLRDRPRA